MNPSSQKVTLLEDLSPRIFQVSTKDVQRAVARYIGLPFVEHGRDMKFGLDCWGLIVCLYRDVVGIELPTYDGCYASTRPQDACPVILEGVQEWKQVVEPQPMDVAIFTIKAFPCHTALMLGPDTFIHSAPKVGVVVERVSSLLWARRLRGYFAYTISTT